MKKIFLFIIVFISLHANAQFSLNKGLILGYSFNENSAIDVSNNKNNGTFAGNSATKDSFGIGIIGKAKYFDGKSVILTTKSNKDLNIGKTKDLAISCWIYSTAKGGSKSFNNWPIIGKLAGASANTDYFLFYEDKGDGTGELMKWGTGNSSDTNAWMVVKNPTKNTWHHIYVTLKYVSSNNYLKEFYIDNKLVKSGTAKIKADSSNSTPFKIGSTFTSFDSKDYFFEGLIDEVYMYNRILSKEERTALFNKVSVPSSSNFTLCNKTQEYLKASNNNKSIKWNTGDTSHKLNLFTGGKYYYTYMDGTNKFISDTNYVSNLNLNSDFASSTRILNTVPNFVSFTNSTPSKNDYSFMWYFGDGDSSSDIEPSHKYTKVGKFNVKLITTVNVTGCKESLIKNNYIESLVGIQNPTNTLNNISIYPNPSTGIYNIQTSVNNINAVVSDVNGRILMNTNQKSIDLSNFQNGIYFLNIYQNGNLISNSKLFLNK